MSSPQHADVTLTTGNDDVILGDGGETVAATAATLTPQTTTTTYPPPDYMPVTTTTGGDTLIGGAGYDTLALSGPGEFRLDQLAAFTGFEALSLSNASLQAATVVLGSQDLAVSVAAGRAGDTFILGGGRISYQAGAMSAPVTFQVSSAAAWNVGDRFEGSSAPGAGPTVLDFYNGNSFGSYTYDLRSATLSNVTIDVGPNPQTFLIDGDTVAGVKTWFSTSFTPSTLVTGDATLDLSHVSINGFDVVSTNPTGTTFIVSNAPTVLGLPGPFPAPSYLQILGGSGHDTLVIQNGALTEDQRTGLFAGTSIDTLTDASGTYDFDPQLVRLTAGADSVTLGDGGRTVLATAYTLTPQVVLPGFPPTVATPGDSLVGGAGYDTLELFGVGNYDLRDLAVFTGFEKVALVNPTDTSSTMTLGAQDLALSVSTGSHAATTDSIYLGSGRVTFHAAPDSGHVAFFQSAASGWNASNDIEGSSDPTAGPVDVYFNYYQDPITRPPPPVYDLRQATLSNVRIVADGDPQVFLIDSHVAADIVAFEGGATFGAAPSTLSTSASILDLSHTTVGGLQVVSTNRGGTTFTVADLATAFSVKGGVGHDTVMLPGLTLTEIQRNALFAGSSIETIVDQSGRYDIDPRIVRLTSGAEAVHLGSGGRTIAATAETLTPETATFPTTVGGDSLIGGSGLDTLALYGGGSYHIDQLASFSGVEKLALYLQSSDLAGVSLGSQTLTLSVAADKPVGISGASTVFYLGDGRVFFHGGQDSGGVEFYATSAQAWNRLNVIEGAAPGANASTQLVFAPSPSDPASTVYDLRSATLSNVSISCYGIGITLLIDSQTAAGVGDWYGPFPGSTSDLLSTSDASLDLTHTSITGFSVVSTNTTGTTFSVASLSNAQEIHGGPGYDTLVVQGLSLSDDQRAAIFAGSSLEVVKDASGTYYAPVHTLQSSFALPAGSSELHYDGSGAFSGTGNALANEVYADGASSATLHGGAGNDQVYGGAGADSLYGDAGADTLYGGAGDDYIRTLTGEGPDTIYGGDGTDLLTIERTGATQNLTADLSLTTLQPLGEGSFFQGIEQIRVAGGSGNDSFVGGGLDDVLKGNGGADTLSGGGGNDVLQGGAGHDSLTGGAGADTFRFDGPVAGSDDTVTDFVSGTDHVALSKAGFGIASLSDFDIVSASSGAFEHKATLVVDTVNHTLSWDADGNGAGAAVLLAHGAFTTAAGDYTLF